ncbi:hypothetical protein K9M48_01310, partial [Candidatus Gracilibacteria bacterium]|nr:hypothetical protein [Candidatus Gracilibacteria bacterium]
VSFSPQRNFPNNTGVSITGIFLDLAGSTGIANFSFTTRPGCDYFGCSEILRIHIGVDVYEFSGSLVMINGTGYGYSPNVPYLSGDTLICSLNYNGATLTGNVDLLSNTGISINGMLYTNNNIYITGLDFSYQNGVIVIPD